MQMALAARWRRWVVSAVGARPAAKPWAAANALKTSLTGLDAELAATVLAARCHCRWCYSHRYCRHCLRRVGLQILATDEPAQSGSEVVSSVSGFGELKNMVDYGDRFGQTSEQVVSGAAKMSKALADLGENGSKLRQQLQSQGMDPNFLARLARVDDLRVANNMLQRVRGCWSRRLELARGKTRIQAKQSARSAAESRLEA